MKKLLVASGLLVLIGLMSLAMPAGNAMAQAVLVPAQPVCALPAAAAACLQPMMALGGPTSACEQCYDSCRDQADQQLFCCLNPDAKECERIIVLESAELKASGGCWQQWNDAKECCSEAREACEGSKR